MTWTLASAAQAALDVQSAVNLSGIVRSFAEILDWMRRADGLNLDTPAANAHPISRLFAEQIAHLTGAGPGREDTYHAAYMACTRAARGT